jgi:archaeal chaperonin
MSRSADSGQKSGEERFATLKNNVNAVKAVSSAVEGTIGPKGLDTMLINDQGEVVITNDGVTILEQMEVKHPAARLMIKIASAQQDKVGDGTTTAAILASALVEEGAAQVYRGVPIVSVIAGMRKGITFALELLRTTAKPVRQVEDPFLTQVAYIAAREDFEIAQLIKKGIQLVGTHQLLSDEWRLSDLISAYHGEESEVFEGVILSKLPISRHMPYEVMDPLVLLMEDTLAPEELDDEALGTEAGFKRFLENKEVFKENLSKLLDLGVKLVIMERSCDPLAEEFCTEHGIAILHRIPRKTMNRLASHLGAKPIKRSGLNKSLPELARLAGKAKYMIADERKGRVRLEGGAGNPVATILVGAATPEIVGERARIAKDAASAAQAAIKGGVVPGGGSVELAIARELADFRKTMIGMEGYGVEVVSAALRRPLAQMMMNAGFNPLEKLDAIDSAQSSAGSNSIGLNFDNGNILDMMENGIIDPALVKIYALRAAGEVAESILRIQTIIRMRNAADENE